MKNLAAEHTHTLADYLYDAIFVGGIGGGLIALFFLGFDAAVHGEAFLTPTILGKVLFEGVAPESIHAADMMAVARYSVVHFAGFGLLGLVISFIVHQAEIHARHPLLVLALVFAVLEVVFWVAMSIALPGVLSRLGNVPVAVANLVAAIGVAVFFMIAHRPERS